MSVALPSLTAFDPETTSEGTLDPLGLYQIADQLATRLVPAVRERMQRIRFLTAMAVGALVTQDLAADPEQPECPPHQIWEWLVVEAMVRTQNTDDPLRGVPGTLVTSRAIDDFGYVDFRSYLKTPRVFGFHGVYKRLAVHVGLVDSDLAPRPEAEQLVNAWARDRGFTGLRDARPLFRAWAEAVERSLACEPCRTRPGWTQTDQRWNELASAFLPGDIGTRERQVLRNALCSDGDRSLGALSLIWELQPEFNDNDYQEESLHARLSETRPSLVPLLSAIAAYERFCRSLEDGFDLIRDSAGRQSSFGYEIGSIAGDAGFVEAVHDLPNRARQAEHRLGELDSEIRGLFCERFQPFLEPMAPGQIAHALCEHHESIQKGKSEVGKRPWFDRLGGDRIHLRQRYRIPPYQPRPGRYVHAYRGLPIRSFFQDIES
jgi:hypothetical protein